MDMTLTMRQQEILREKVRGLVQFDEPMQRHTTMQVGGPADAWIQPADVDDLVAILHAAQEMGLAWFAVGRGSNLVVRDGGIRGLVINLAKLEALHECVEEKVARLEPSQVCHAEAVTVYVEAGVRLKRLLGFCGEHGLSGVEGLEGVPGSVGGAIIMNAGTPAGVIGDAIIDVTMLDKHGAVVTRTKEQLAFSYRKAKIARQAIVLSARLQLQRAPAEDVRARLAELRAKREKAQPGTQPTVGSVFRNPDQRSAWSLIDEAGLRGVRIGRARVSDLHANWIVNEGGATARDVETLMKLMREQVKERCGVLLDPEVIIVGEERNL